MDYVQQGCVVFVDEHDHFLPGLCAGSLDDTCKPVVESCLRLYFSVDILVFEQLEVEHGFQLLFLHVLGHAHVEVQHRMHSPVLFQRLYGQSLEELLASFEVRRAPCVLRSNCEGWIPTVTFRTSSGG